MNKSELAEMMELRTELTIKEKISEVKTKIYYKNE